MATPRPTNSITSFPTRALAVTPSDSTYFSEPSTIYVGTAGDVTVEPELGGNVITFAMQTGGLVPVLVRRVLEVTDAEDLVRVF